MIFSLPLLAVYPYVIKFKRKTWYSPVLAIFAGLATLYDILLNYTEWWFIFGKPQKGQYTISKRLKWMMENDPLPARREFARIVFVYLDAGEDDGEH
jgi:hypothetical protein